MHSSTRIAYENAGRLETLIDDILDVEKIAAGGMEFYLKSINASKLIVEALKANKEYGDKFDVEFVFNVTDDRLMVSGDKKRLMQVITNLLSNAAKFSRQSGKVDIFVSRSENGNICFAGTDYGSGIPEAAQATIFDSFTQAASSDQRETEWSKVDALEKNVCSGSLLYSH